MMMSLNHGWCIRKSTAAVIMAQRPPQSLALVMSRGIHLKQLTNTDLGLLGLPDDLLEAEDPSAGPRQLSAERDPALATIIREVLVTLQDALVLLDQALAFGQGPTPIRAPALDRNARPLA